MHPGMFFIDNSLLRGNDLRGSYGKHEFASFLSLNHIGFSQFPKNWESRKASYTENERIICAIHGEEVFALVSPMFTQNMYIGLFEQFPSDHCPIDLFRLNRKHHPLTRAAVVSKTTLSAGQCLYVPSFWWVQQRTSSKVS